MLDKLVRKWRAAIVEERPEPGYLVQCWECGRVQLGDYPDTPCVQCGGLVEVLQHVAASGQVTNFPPGRRPRGA